MRALVRLTLILTLGLPGVLRAAENLPLLRVDPALLGGASVVPATPSAPQARSPASGETAPAAQAQPSRQGEPEPARAAQQEEPVTKPPAKAQTGKEKNAPAATARKGKPTVAADTLPRAASSALVEKVERPEPALLVAPERKKEEPVAVSPSVPVAAESAKPMTRPAVQAVASPPVQPAAQSTILPATSHEPPVVEERPTLPPLYSSHAEAGRISPPLQSSDRLHPLPEGKGIAYPAFITADRIDGSNDNEVVAKGDAELRQANTSLSADRLTYWKVEDELEAEGNVRYAKNADRISGPKMHLNMTDNTGYFDQPVYSMTRVARLPKQEYSPVLGSSAQSVKKFPSFIAQEKKDKDAVVTIAGEVVDKGQALTTASGKADRLDFLGENRRQLTNATYSTCAAEDPDWYAKAAQLDLDFDNETGEARDATVIFKGVPLFYSPWLGFSLNNKRKSGLLAPTFGTSSKSGIEFTLPYYWDIAPNMDMTIAPRLMSKRGLQINSEFRYLNYNYNGLARLEWLPDDRLANRNRYAFSILHNQTYLANGFTGYLNVNGVSDGAYLRDLSSRINEASQGNLLRQGMLTYGGGWWSATANVQTYQTLQDPALLYKVTKPYERLPQILLTASRPEFIGGTAFAFNGEYVNFDHPSLVTARRLTLYPQLSLPLQSAAWYVTPKIGMHSTRYDIDRKGTPGPDNVVRNLPVFSVDAGVAFEREMDWFGKGLTQTLEPRLFYLAIPQRTQDEIPVFDSGLADFNFATIFSDNIYSGVDRIADANQLTAALTSRLIDPQTGEEYVRGMVGQRYYFAKQHVTLPGESARPGGTSDFLAALSGRLLPKTYVDTAWQYDPRDGQTERFSLGGRWQPDFAKVFNASYRYTRDHTLTGGTPGIRQVDFSAQWPLTRGWYGIGRFNYSLKERKIIETIAGLEYNGGCWVGRVVVQRYATATSDTNTALFFQLELNDFSKIGSNPLELLSRRIPGYGRINQPAASPVFGYD